MGVPGHLLAAHSLAGRVLVEWTGHSARGSSDISHGPRCPRPRPSAPSCLGLEWQSGLRLQPRGIEPGASNTGSSAGGAFQEFLKLVLMQVLAILISGARLIALC